MCFIYPQLQVQTLLLQEQLQTIFGLVLVFVLVTVCWFVWLILSLSLLVFVAALLAVWLCEMVGLLVFVLVTVTFVVGDPMSEMLKVMGTLWEATHANPAPSPVQKHFTFLTKAINFFTVTHLQGLEWQESTKLQQG